MIADVHKNDNNSRISSNDRSYNSYKKWHTIIFIVTFTYLKFRTI